MVELVIKDLNVVKIEDKDYVDAFLSIDCKYDTFLEALDEVYIPLRDMDLKIGNVIIDISIFNDGSIAIKIPCIRSNHVKTCVNVITYELSYLAPIARMEHLFKCLEDIYDYNI